MNPYGYTYGYHPAPPPVDPGGSIPVTTNQPEVAMMAPRGYISAAPSPLTLCTTRGWGQCRWVGPFHLSLLFCPLGVCSMVRAWFVVEYHVRCSPISQTCDYARTNKVPVSWVGVRLGLLSALHLQGWVCLPGIGKFCACADFLTFINTHVHRVRPQVFVWGSMSI